MVTPTHRSWNHAGQILGAIAARQRRISIGIERYQRVSRKLAEAVALLGAEHFLFTTDYPHDDPGGRMKFKDVKLLTNHPKLSEADKSKIRWDNARVLFDLV